MVLTPTTRLPRRTTLLLVLAALWGVVQLVLAFFVHIVARGHETSTGFAVPATKTYFEADALSEVVLTVVVLALVAIVGALLHRRVSRGLGGAGRLAWSVAAVTAVLGVVGFVFMLGVGACLLGACASVPRHRVVPGIQRRSAPAVAG